MHTSQDLSVPIVAKATFLIEGFAALIAWNSILTAFDFLNLSFPDYDVAFTLTIPIYIGQTFFALFIYKISQIMTLNARIVSSLTMMAIILVILPLVAKYLARESAGFWVCAALMVFIGMGNSLMQSSGIALVSLFPAQCITYFFTGTGLAGILICLLRMIILASFGDSNDGIVLGTIIYFTISGVFLILTIMVHFCFRRTIFCKFYIKKARSKTLLHQEEIVEDIVLGPINIQKEIQKELNKRETLEELLMKNFYEVDLIPFTNKPLAKCSDMSQSSERKPQLSVETKNIEMEIRKKRGEAQLSEFDLKTNFFLDASTITLRPNDEKNTWRFVYKVLKKIHPFPLLCWLIFVQTFMMFPGVSLKKHLSGMTFSMSCTLLILVFNIFDTVGKYIADSLPKPSIRMFYLIIFLRFLIFPLFLLMTDRWKVDFIGEDWFSYVNMTVFAITHGFVVSNLMICAPDKANDNEKETAGFIMSLPLTIGIVTGSLLALSFAWI